MYSSPQVTHNDLELSDRTTERTKKERSPSPHKQASKQTQTKTLTTTAHIVYHSVVVIFLHKSAPSQNSVFSLLLLSPPFLFVWKEQSVSAITKLWPFRLITRHSVDEILQDTAPPTPHPPKKKKKEEACLAHLIGLVFMRTCLLAAYNRVSMPPVASSSHIGLRFWLDQFLTK